MITVNEKILDASTLHAVRLERYKNNIVRRMIAVLNRTDTDLNIQLIKALEKLEGSEFNIKRIDNVLKSVRELNAETYATINEELATELKDLTEYETGYQQKLFKDVIPLEIAFESVVAEQVYAAAMARPFQGKLLKEWIAGLEADKAAKIRDAVRMGVIEGQTINEIVRRVRGTKALAYKDGIIDITRRNAEAIVRTAVAHTTNFARESLMKANEDILNGEQYVSVLDSRTTPICQSLDGEIFAVGKGAIPPMHIGCRSTRVAVVKSWQELGFDIDDVPASTRASMTGQVPASQDYGQWLKKQPIEIQNEVLGIERGKIYRENNLPISSYVNDAGQYYTLEQLRKLDIA